MTASAVSLLGVQARVIGALVLREARASFGNSQLGYLWAIASPAAATGILVFLFSFIGRQPPFGSSLALFFATGLLTLQYFTKLSNTLMTAFSANRALLTYPLIKETDTLFARLVLVSATHLLIMALFYGTLVLGGLAPLPSHPEHLAYAFGATALIGFGFGTTNAVIVSLWENWGQVEKVLTRPLFFISGVFYVPSMLPREAVTLLQWNPVLHLVEWMREGYYPNYESVVLDRTFVIGVGLALVLVGLAGERLFRKRRS